jgi:hypothetical protein
MPVVEDEADAGRLLRHSNFLPTCSDQELQREKKTDRNMLA